MLAEAVLTGTVTTQQGAWQLVKEAARTENPSTEVQFVYQTIIDVNDSVSVRNAILEPLSIRSRSRAHRFQDKFV